MIDGLIDLHWVRAPTVSMHLGLIDGPSVPHNLISAQQSPVPLPKFQMAPRLKILMASGSKKEPRYTLLFSQKVTASESLPGSPMWPLWSVITRLQGIFTSVLIYLFISKSLRKERPSLFPKSGVPIDKRPFQNLNISFGVSSKGALPPGPPHGVPSEKDAAFLE